MIPHRLPTVVALAALAACSSDTSLPVAAQCNPLGDNHCMTPWPSSAFEVEDETTATGRRLAIPLGALPKNIDNIETKPDGWNVADGFSPAAPMVMSWKGGVSTQGLPPVDNMDISLSADSPTVILDMTTGTRVAHFAEVDAPAEATPDSQALLLRPGQRLIGGHRYAVAITNRVHAKNGDDLAVPPGFAALRDGKHTDHGLLEAMRPRFEEVLDKLEAAGVAPDDLVVAWDFTVASDAHIVSDAVTARDRAIAALASHPIAYTITSDTDQGGFRQLKGTLEAPLFLTNGGAVVAGAGDVVGTRLARDAAQLPALQGFYRIPFEAIVPACAKTSLTPVGMVIYGHGLLGDAGEAVGGVQKTTAAELCVVFAGTDMRGMSTPDLPQVVGALNEIARANEIFEVLVQGIVNHVTLVKALRTTFAETLFVDGAKRLVNPTKVYYYGISQGGIFGTAVMAYEPTVTRGVLGVGAANYSMLLDRSLDWPRYAVVLAGAYPDPIDVVLAINLFQMRWDKVEGSGVAHAVQQGTLTGTPPKQILMQIAIADEQVPNIGSWWQARSMGIPVLGPSPMTPWGLTVRDTPLADGSAIVILDGGAPMAPATNVPPPTDLKMHAMPRKQGATRRQIQEFFTTGRIVNACAGACVCPTGACD